MTHGSMHDGSPHGRAPAHPSSPPLPEREPAVLVTPRLDVLHANSRWQALHQPLTENRNLARMVFLDPSAAQFFMHLRHEEVDVLATLAEAGREQEWRADVTSFIDELSAANPEVDRLRAGLSVRPLRRDRYLLRHPDVGVLQFVRRSRRVGPHLLRICAPSPETERSLALLDLLWRRRDVEPAPSPAR